MASGLKDRPCVRVLHSEFCALGFIGLGVEDSGFSEFSVKGLGVSVGLQLCLRLLQSSISQSVHVRRFLQNLTPHGPPLCTSGKQDL